MKEQVKILSLLGSYQELLSLLDNLLLSPKELWEIYSALPQDLNHEDLEETQAIEVAKKLIKHPNLSPEQLLFFLSHKKATLKNQALIHPNFPIDILSDLAETAIKKNNLKQLDQLCGNNCFPKEFISKIIQMGVIPPTFSRIYRIICLKGFLPEHFEYYCQSFKNAPSHLRILIKNPNTPSFVFERFKDSLWQEIAFYQHPNCPTECKAVAFKNIEKHLPQLAKEISPFLQGKKAS